MNIVNEGIMQFGDYNEAAMAGDQGTATNVRQKTGLSTRELDALRQLMSVLEHPAVQAELHDDAREVIEEEAAMIAAVVERQAPTTSAVRKSIKTILGLAGQLIIGAAGNGLYEALKQMV